MPEPNTIHPTIQLDPKVPRKNESEQHWAVKAAIVHQIRSDPAYKGEIKTEKKTSDLIGDIRCHLSEKPADVPDQFVVEVETAESKKDRLRATIQHLRFGYAVYWVFLADTHTDRRDTETLLGNHMLVPPSLGVASLEEGELSLGSPITWNDFSIPVPFLGRHEFYVPTYDRSEAVFDHGDFQIDGDRVAIYRVPGTEKIYASWHLGNGQMTLPDHAPWQKAELRQRLREGDVKRVAPVRGSP